MRLNSFFLLESAKAFGEMAIYHNAKSKKNFGEKTFYNDVGATSPISLAKCTWKTNELSLTL